MKKALYYSSFFGGILISILGLLILLIKNDTGQHPHVLATVTTVLIFVVGLFVILYIVKNKGIS